MIKRDNWSTIKGVEWPEHPGDFRKVFSGEKLMAVLNEVTPPAVPLTAKPKLHSHPHEQMGICLAGEAEFICGSVRKRVSEGMVYSVEPNEKHEVRMLGSEGGLFLDVFSPPRVEYLSMQKSFENQEINKSQL